MTLDDVVAGVFDREGDTYADRSTVPPADQPTARGGLILPTLQRYIAATNAALTPTVSQLRSLTHDQAAAIIRWVLEGIVAEGHLDQIGFEPLRWQVADFAYNSGTARAIRWLQRVLGVPDTGVLDAMTVGALKFPYDKDRIPLWIHESLIAARILMVESAVDSGAVGSTFERGLARRAEKLSLLSVSG